MARFSPRKTRSEPRAPVNDVKAGKKQKEAATP